MSGMGALLTFGLFHKQVDYKQVHFVKELTQCRRQTPFGRMCGKARRHRNRAQLRASLNFLTDTYTPSGTPKGGHINNIDMKLLGEACGEVTEHGDQNPWFYSKLRAHFF